MPTLFKVFGVSLAKRIFCFSKELVYQIFFDFLP